MNERTTPSNPPPPLPMKESSNVTADLNEIEDGV